MGLSADTRATLYFAGWILNGILFLATAFFAWMASEPMAVEPKWFANIHLEWDREYWKAWAWGIGCFSAIQAWVMANLCPPWVHETVEKILDGFRDQLFLGEVDHPVDFDKVTLFRCCRRSWLPWNKEKHLKLFARSGHTEAGRCVIWPVEGSKDIGVTGRCWLTKMSPPSQNLPDLTPAAVDADVEKYAEESYVSAEWVRNRIQEPGRRPLPRSIYTTLIEVENQPWGVLVIDSRCPSIPKPQRVSHLLPCIADVLSTLLTVGKKR
jgi:hypothetical protein